MLVLPDSSICIASNEAVTLTIDADASIDRAVLRPRFGGEQAVAVSENGFAFPVLKSPDSVRIDWESGGEALFTTYAEVVSRHYFGLDQLKGYGDGQDDFGSLPEEALYQARQAATEVFEQNAKRSFVKRIGRTKDYGGGSYLQLWHNDVDEALTEGYRLVSDCQAVREPCTPVPCWVEYVYGLSDVPAQVSRAVLELAAYMLRPSNRPVGATGESTDAGFIRFTTAGQDGATDIPEVNAAIAQFGRGANPLW